MIAGERTRFDFIRFHFLYIIHLPLEIGEQIADFTLKRENSEKIEKFLLINSLKQMLEFFLLKKKNILFNQRRWRFL